MTESSREARRRRILERGNDRLALITGQIRNLPSDSGSNPPQSDSLAGDLSSPPSTIQAQLPSSPPPTLDSPHRDDKTSGPLLPNPNSVPENSQQKSSDDRAESLISSSDSITRPADLLSRDHDGEGSSIQQNLRDSRSYKDQHLGILTHLHNLFSFSEVKSAISASESTRMVCSVAVALLVVLANVGFPVLGSRLVKSVIFFRPLYLLLLTNITIVIALLLEKQRGLPRPERQTTGNRSTGEQGLVDQLGAALELGLFISNVTGALLMDGSIYAIALVCGFSLAKCIGF
ncbi:OLC1v1028964C1 [Oldenlandia corymbosa var. corymbosa]|uniref:OLC1v1028964C1 n=1 Tax=Oldenlandia corymbosa var. corymbosa TaxID=529605 RepID=A0AAV1CFT6_OLDCO|nr:OLC1v1028964C1 [Oldenlandia corymbosa var. corymbosa]